MSYYAIYSALLILVMNEVLGVHMSFYKESAHYEKTALSDLQGAWTFLRDTVVENFGFPGSDKIIFHIDEVNYHFKGGLP